ncbi:MAG TPA: response regulator [Noviherbaspirillum sp.]
MLARKHFFKRKRMTTSMTIPVKPRVLIADDSRIVRATLIKHIEGMFEFREALDGEQAWETLLLDPSIRVVITDLTMPKLDGYGLLQRIRSSKIGRIRDIPVVVVSGSDDQEERKRAKDAGATDLITKGIGTAQLLSRLDILSRLVGTQHDFERGLESFMTSPPEMEHTVLPSMERVCTVGESLLASAVKGKRNFVVLNVCVGIRHDELPDVIAAPPVAVVHAIGQLLQQTIRQTDLVATSGEAEFTLATGAINFDAARRFAHRVSRAIAHAQLVNDKRMAFIASCGLASLSEGDIDASEVTLPLMLEVAHRRAILGLNRGITGVIGREEEAACARGDQVLPLAARVNDEAYGDRQTDAPDLVTLLQWVKSGRQHEVLPHIGKLSTELQPLFDLLLKQEKK